MPYLVIHVLRLGHCVGDLFPQDRYATWSTLTCERLAELHLRELVAAADVLLHHGDATQSLLLCKRVLAKDPWREDAVWVGMRASLALEDRPAALKLYHALETELRKELSLAPRDDLRRLAASIRIS